MAAFTLAKAKPSAALKYYLDTSAIYPIAWDEGATNGGAPAVDVAEKARASAVSTFLRDATAAGAEVRTSLLAIEEIAGKVRNGERRRCWKAKGFSDWRSYAIGNSAGARADGPIIQTKMLEWIGWSIRAVLSRGVQFERRVVQTPAGAATLSKKSRETYVELLHSYPDLDAMDALHIVVGKEIGADAFVTFDAGWRAVSEIDVYHD